MECFRVIPYWIIPKESSDVTWRDAFARELEDYTDSRIGSQRDVVKSFRGIWEKAGALSRAPILRSRNISNKPLHYVHRTYYWLSGFSESPIWSRSRFLRRLGARNAALLAFRRWNKGSFFDWENKGEWLSPFATSYRSPPLAWMVSPGRS